MDYIYSVFRQNIPIPSFIRLHSMRMQLHQVMVAAILLAIGLLVYLLDRPADQIYFVSDWWKFTLGAGQIFGTIGAYLSTFIHVMVFILISSAMLAPWRFRVISICFLWLCIDSLFELAPHNAISSRIIDIVPSFFQDIVLFENITRYFLMSSFDLFVLISISLGSVSAYLIFHYIHMQESDNVSK